MVRAAHRVICFLFAVASATLLLIHTTSVAWPVEDNDGESDSAIAFTASTARIRAEEEAAAAASELRDGHRASPLPLLPEASEGTRRSSGCSFTAGGGAWDISESPPPSSAALGGSEDEGDDETPGVARRVIATWRPEVDAAYGCPRSADPLLPRRYRRFSQGDALRCLSGKTVVLYGNSNTRTLYTALEALLRGKPQVSRLAAKQLCDNTKRNHSCWMRISPSDLAAAAAASSAADFEPIALHYWGYTDDLYHPSLRAKLAPHFHTADLLVGNAGLNRIQAARRDAEWRRSHETTGLQLVQTLLPSFTRPGFVFAWHTTTPLCPHQPHFRRYKFQKRFWGGRTLQEVNTAIDASNRLAVAALSRGTSSTASTPPRVVIIDDASLMGHRIAGNATSHGVHDLCALYEDPLHHRFLDKQVVQLLLNAYCP